MERKRLIGDYVHHWAQRQPEAEALVWGDIRLSYAAVLAEVGRCARALIAAGVEKGDRVAMISSARPEVIVAYLAASEIGAVFVGLNPRAQLDEYRYLLANSAPRVLMTMAAFDGRDYLQDLQVLAQEGLAGQHRVTLEGRVDGLSITFADFLAAGDSVPESEYSARRQAVQPEDVALIVYTSGSTGKPKGALLTHRSVVAGMSVQSKYLAGSGPPRMMLHLPINHFGALGNIATATLILGGTICFLDRFSPAGSMELIERERITTWGQVPTMFLLQLALPNFQRYDLSNLELVFFSGSPMPRQAVERLSTLDAALFTGYGLTETSGPVTLSVPGASVAELSETIGRPLPEFEFKIADEDGNPVQSGQVGEMCIRGGCVFKGYFNDRSATNAAIDSDGWFHSGDLGLARNDGNVQLVGRLNERFKSGGYNVDPYEVEKTLEQHPAVAMACVVAVPDLLYHQVGHAFLLLKQGEAFDETEMRAFCHGRLSNYKVPKRFIVREQFPMLAVGKVDRKVLTEQARAELGRV